MSRSTFRVLFYLKRNAPKKNGMIPVMCRITVNGKVSQFSSKLDVEEKMWNVELGKLTGRSLVAQEGNRMLDKIRLGINKNITWHQSRHSYATTICLSNGVPIETLSKMMGHTSIRSTQIYAKITAEKVSNDMERLSKQIESMEQFICQTI